MKKEINKDNNLENFSLGIGGSLYKIFELFGLSKNLLIHTKQRIFVILFVTWVPLLILATLGGVAFSGVELSFIRDVDVHVRFLIVLGMLIYAEIIAHDRIQLIVGQFLKCNIIATKDRHEFNRIIMSVMRFRESLLIEIGLIILVYTVGHWISKKYLSLGVSNWFSVNVNDIVTLTPAGYWYIFVSLPIFQFILLRWYFRMAVWYRFLWQISRLPLQLNSLHPDRAGGLGFLADSIYAFAPFLLAHSVLLTGMIFNRIWNTGAGVSDFQVEIISTLILVLIIPLIPLLFFAFQMSNEKRLGTLNYDVFANHYANDFRQKWMAANTKYHSSLLGSPDIQSLADLFNSFEVSNKMRVTPFGKNSVIALAVLTALPLVPLVLTVIPMEKIISQLFGLIF